MQLTQAEEVELQRLVARGIDVDEEIALLRLLLRASVSDRDPRSAAAVAHALVALIKERTGPTGATTVSESARPVMLRRVHSAWTPAPSVVE